MRSYFATQNGKINWFDFSEMKLYMNQIDMNIPGGKTTRDIHLNINNRFHIAFYDYLLYSTNPTDKFEPIIYDTQTSSFKTFESLNIPASAGFPAVSGSSNSSGWGSPALVMFVVTTNYIVMVTTSTLLSSPFTRHIRMFYFDKTLSSFIGVKQFAVGVPIGSAIEIEPYYDSTLDRVYFSNIQGGFTYYLSYINNIDNFGSASSLSYYNNSGVTLEWHSPSSIISRMKLFRVGNSIYTWSNNNSANFPAKIAKFDMDLNLESYRSADGAGLGDFGNGITLGNPKAFGYSSKYNKLVFFINKSSTSLYRLDISTDLTTITKSEIVTSPSRQLNIMFLDETHDIVYYNSPDVATPKYINFLRTPL